MVRRAMLRGIITCVFLLLPLGAAAEDVVTGTDGRPEPSDDSEWRLHDRDDDPETGYVVYTRRPRGSSYDAYRLEAAIDAPPALVAAAARAEMADPHSGQSNVEKTIVRDVGDELVVYSYADLPLVSDRDVTTRIHRSFDPQSGTYRLEWQATDEEGPPPKPGVIRIEHSSGSWTFSPLEGGRTRAVYENHNDLAGSIPGWLINSLMTDSVVDNIVKLRARVRGDVAGREADLPRAN